MSAEATAYVTQLRECPDGAELNSGHKAMLWSLADHHNRSTRQCNPSLELVCDDSRLSLATVKRHADYLERHCVIERRHPKGSGRGKYVEFVFLFLDEPERLARKLSELSKGAQAEPLFYPQQRGSEGAQSTGRTSSEGAQIEGCNKEEPRTKGNLKPKPTAGCGKPIGTPVWEKLHANLVDKTLAELRNQAAASVGDGWQFREHTPQEQAAHVSERMHDACLRAGVWPHVAAQIRDEFYQCTLHEELAKVNQRLEEHGYSDEQHA